ncbi:AAA family ATPase [Streptomyces thinghirensis]|nr:AAA family ATPase [Streptomyces thinghirensis]
MHLKALTLRGFKSFASATTLRFEPGITCVVGPNGSGDVQRRRRASAGSWANRAPTLRGGKMEDVIFAGTTGRPPLGRAEVSLTIDNSDGPCPSSTPRSPSRGSCSATAAARYQINGDTCRLLDIQELLDPASPRDARHRRPGSARLRPARRPRWAPRLHRGGRRRPQAPQAQGKAPGTGRDAGQPRSRAGPPTNCGAS